MNTVIWDTTTRSGCFVKRFRHCLLIYRVLGPRLLGVVIVFLLVSLLQAGTRAQEGEFFEVKSIIRDVKLRFALSQADMHRLGPLIEKENQEVLVIYSHFDGYEEGYPIDLWREVVRRRSDFESRITTGLQPRQRAALRTARTALEGRVLSYLVDDYVHFLADFLELDSLQLEAVGRTLTTECSRRHLVIISSLSRPALLQGRLDQLARDTDLVLKIVLSPDQYRLYRSLFAATKGPVG